MPPCAQFVLESDIERLVTTITWPRSAASSANVRPATPLPRHDRVTNVAKDVRRQRRRARLPPKPDGAAELAVPHPKAVARKPSECGAVRRDYRGALGLPIDQACNKGVWIVLNLGELLLRCDRATNVVRRPPTLESIDISRQVDDGRCNEL